MLLTIINNLSGSFLLPDRLSMNLASVPSLYWSASGYDLLYGVSPDIEPNYLIKVDVKLLIKISNKNMK